MRADNREVYERGPVASRYAGRSELQPAEAAILRRYKGELSGRRILDLGVGGGRTTPFLLALSAEYVGVDYSSEMVSRCRARFPAVDFRVEDARDLSAYSDASFDFVLFSYNGIDEMEHADRLRTLKEIHRVLKEGGLFAFSSHNRDVPIRKPWDLRHLAVSPLRHPLRFGKRVVSYPVGIINYLRRAHRNQIHDEYCIAVDISYMYSLVHYFIRAADQRKQLERLGFTEVEALGNDGRSISTSEPTPVADPWIYYSCRRGS